MIAIIVCLAAMVGLSLNLAFSVSLQQPDWALALLLAALLAQRHNWVWVLPMMMLHDVILHWSFGATLIGMAAIPVAMIYFDQHLGAGLPQRLALMIMAALTLTIQDWAWGAAILTALLCVPLWYLLTRRYAQTAA